MRDGDGSQVAEGSDPRMKIDAEATPVTSCCDHHDDWPTLAQHIADDFADVPVGDVAAELRAAREAVASFQVEDDALRILETIARHRLLQRADALDRVAGLDPQRRTDHRTAG